MQKDLTRQETVANRIIAILADEFGSSAEGIGHSADVIGLVGAALMREATVMAAEVTAEYEKELKKKVHGGNDGESK